MSRVGAEVSKSSSRGGNGAKAAYVEGSRVLTAQCPRMHFVQSCLEVATVGRRIEQGTDLCATVQAAPQRSQCVR